MRVDERERGDRGVRLRAVDQRDALPSAPSVDRREAGARAACPPRRPLSVAARAASPSPISDEREMRERREIAARADASLLRNRRIQPGVQHAEQQLGELEARAGIALRDHVRAQQHHRAHLALGQQIADAGGMAANEIDLQLGESLRRNRDLGQLAEAGRHAVRDRALGDEVIDDRCGSRCALARVRREGDRSAVARDRRNLLERERISVDDDFVDHGGNVEPRHSDNSRERLGR